MNSERIKEIQSETAYPQSVSVMLALEQVWNECEQSSKWISIEDYLPEQETPVLIYIISGGAPQILIGAYVEQKGENYNCWYDWQSDDTFDDEPTFWQALPHPPK